MSIDLMAATRYNPPAELVWSDTNSTMCDGEKWVLFTRSADMGKGGWSGTDEWHFAKHLDRNGRQVPDDGRWVADPGKKYLKQAKRIAAWLITNQEHDYRLTITQIEVLLDVCDAGTTARRAFTIGVPLGECTRCREEVRGGEQDFEIVTADNGPGLKHTACPVLV